MTALLFRATLVFSTLQAATALAQLKSESTRLFDGETLEGWQVAPSDNARTSHWAVVDGVIRGENPDKLGSNLWTNRPLGDYELSLEYRSPSEYYDSGVFVRGESHQVQIGISGSLQRDMTACIYAPGDGRGGYPAKSDKIGPVHRVGEWNQLRVVVEGDRIRTFLNGEPMVDYEAATMPTEGPIGLQLHAGHHMRMLFRDVTLREIE